MLHVSSVRTNTRLSGITTKDIWMTADIQIKEEEFPKTNEITGVFDERGFVAFFPLKEKERRFRMAINVINPPGDVPLGQELSLEELQKVVDERSTSMVRIFRTLDRARLNNL
jgi:2-polyprenyl-6-methoxyphenol hydroxylase-like FAD-dependent oxidoreductase